MESSIITLTEENIRRAIADYTAHTYQTEGIEDVSEAFIERLARDSVTAKPSLRALFQASPAWDDNLQAMVINGTRTHDPNYAVISDLVERIISPVRYNFDYETLNRAILFFTNPNGDKASYVAALNEIAPRAYAPNKKVSRIFKAFCNAIGVVDNNAGSDFQRLFAQVADELSSKKIDFKLFVSINAAHFLTMSNPKEDQRGSTMVSCHSFNSTEYPYNNGCTGYARDDVSFIVFTASDPKNAETLNNRKTSRQMFMYKAHNGLLLQSRMYRTQTSSYGGVNGDTPEGRLYRDLIQREIAALEEVPNLWVTRNYYENEFNVDIRKHEGFGGYADWLEFTDCAKISILKSYENSFKTFKVGSYGLCVSCGDITSDGLYCSDCKEEGEICDECGCRVSYALNGVYNREGEYIYVCDECLDWYSRCDYCEEWHHHEDMTTIANGEHICSSCLADHYTYCENCEEYYSNYEVYPAVNRNGCEIWICTECRDEYYEFCPICERYVHVDDAITAYDEKGKKTTICPSCHDYFEECDSCGRLCHEDYMIEGTCRRCHSEEEEE